MPAPSITLDFQHAWNPLKGWPHSAAVDHDAKMSANVSFWPLYSGRIVHKNAAGEFEAGAVGTQMPLMLIPGSADFDVTNVSAAGAYGWYPVGPTGKMSGLVAVGGFELETTEFDANATFAINDVVHAPVEAQITGSDKSDAGKLYKTRSWPGGNAGAITQYVDHVCGCVSRPVHNNQLRVPVLAIWLVYLPGNSANT